MPVTVPGQSAEKLPAPEPSPAPAVARDESLDTLRGLAIVIMIVDHFLMLVLSVEIEPYNGRFFTRLAEPLFALLVGYFLVGRGRRRVASRLAPLFLAAALANLLFWGVFAKLEILATLLLVFALYLILAERLWVLLPAMALGAFDPTQAYLDYPLSVVAAQVAMGMLLHQRWGLCLPLLAVAASVFLPAPIAYTAAFTLPAALLIEIARRRRGIALPVLAQVGRHALAAYVVQLVLIFAIAIAFGLAGGGSAWVLESLKAGYGG